MSLPFSAEDTIRLHDAAFFNWLSGFKVDYNNISGAPQLQVPMLAVMAAPHRAFATVVDTLVSRGWVNQADPKIAQAMADQEWPVLPLPVATIERDDPIMSGQLALVPGKYRTNAFNPYTGQWDTYAYPSHYLTQYRLTFWCEKKYTHAYFIEWLMSQLGAVGAGYTEVYIPVQHAQPFGTQLHALRYLGSANMDDLEGAHPRHIRKMLSFTLRSWFMRQPPVAGNGASPVFNVRQDQNILAQDGTSVIDSEVAPGRLNWGTFNLYNSLSTNIAGSVAAYWPSYGAAVVTQAAANAPGRTQDLTVSVTAATDIVPLLDRIIPLNSYGYNLIRIAGMYQSSAAAELTVSNDGVTVDTTVAAGTVGFTATTSRVVSAGTLAVTVAGNAWTLVPSLANTSATAQVYTATTNTNGTVTVTFGDGLSNGGKPVGAVVLTYGSSSAIPTFSAALPAATAWTPFQIYAVTEATRFQVNIAGTGVAANVTLSGTDVRVLNIPSKVAPSSWSSSAGTTKYNWTGLAYQPYIAVVVYMVNGAPFTVTVSNAASAPTTVATLPCAVSTFGVGALLQPTGTTATLSLPTSVAVTDIYLLPYTGITKP